MFSGKLTEAGATRMLGAGDKKGVDVDFDLTNLEGALPVHGVAHEVRINGERTGGFLSFGDPKTDPTVGIDITQNSDRTKK